MPCCANASDKHSPTGPAPMTITRSEGLSMRRVRSCFVTLGLDPRVHRLRRRTEVLVRQGMDCRVKPGNDGLSRALLHQFFATTSFTAPTQPVWVRSNTIPSGSLYFAS